MSLASLEEVPYTRHVRKKATEALSEIEALMTVKQAAEAKEVSTSAIYNAIESGKLHPQRVGEIQVLFRWEVEQWQPQRRGPKRKG